MMTQKKKRICLSLVCVLCVLVLIAGTFFVYTGVYYHAEDDAISSCAARYPSIEVTHPADNVMAVGDRNATTAFVFYPGAKVEGAAYLPLLYAIANCGILCLLVEVPFRLAVLAPNAADDAIAAYPNVDTWFVGGHSLGGAIAATYAAKHAETLAGLVILGAYTTDDLSETQLRVLSVYGSEDGVLNREKYASCTDNLPDTFTEQVIVGGCHAYFGMYGTQRGDGTPTIDQIQQIEQTAACITAFICD